MKSNCADFAALATLRYLDDLIVKMSGNNKNSDRTNLNTKLNKLNFDVFHGLTARQKPEAALYALVDWRVCRMKSVQDIVLKSLLNANSGGLSSESHAQILNLVRKMVKRPLNELIAVGLSKSIESSILMGKMLQPLHSKNLM